jgi:hypothetical protein
MKKLVQYTDPVQHNTIKRTRMNLSEVMKSIFFSLFLILNNSETRDGQIQ